MKDKEQPAVQNIQTDWVEDMTRFLQTGRCPEGLERSKRRYYRLQAIPYCLMNGILFKKDLQGVLLRCIKLDQVEHILYQFHEGPAGGHFSPRATALKVMKAGYYWPSVFKDAHLWVRKCKQCAIFAGKEKLSAMPLQPIQVEQPFMK